MYKRLLTPLAVLLLTLSVAGCGQKAATGNQGGDPASSAATVVVKEMAFTPSKVRIKAGQSVTWKFEDGDVRHDVSSDDGSFKSKVALSGTYTHSFAEPGAFGYDCSLHPTMTGTVVVTK